MAYYAFLDENNVVTEVITGIDETELIEGLDPETWYGNFRGQVCKRTSFNGNIRGRHAGIGYTYNPDADVFIAPKPFASWRHAGNYEWEPPVPYPTDLEGQWFWDESIQQWVR